MKNRYVPPFIPDEDESYFDLEYLDTQIKEHPQNYFPIKDILSQTNGKFIFKLYL